MVTVSGLTVWASKLPANSVPATKCVKALSFCTMNSPILGLIQASFAARCAARSIEDRMGCWCKEIESATQRPKCSYTSRGGGATQAFRYRDSRCSLT
jgi:hypothetical protein